MNAATSSMARWWQRLERRERLLVAAAGGVLVAALVYLLLWQPAADGIRRLRTDLPQLQEQDAAMRAMSGEVTALRSAAGSAPPIAVAERSAAVRRSLERAGLWRGTNGSATVASDPAAIDPLVERPPRTLTVGGAVTTVGTTAAIARVAPDVVADDDRVRVRFDDVDYGVWAGWLVAAEAELSARAVRVSVQSNAPKAPVGHVRAEALLDWTSSSAPVPAFSRP